MNRSSASLVILLALLCLLVACSGGTATPQPSATAHTPAPTSAQTPAPSTSQVPSPTPSAAPTAAPTLAASPPPASANDLADGWAGPGRYTANDFARFSFVAGDGWTDGGVLPGAGFYLLYGDRNTGGSLTVTRFDGEVPTDPCDTGKGTTQIDATPAGLIDHLGSIDGLALTPQTELEVAGYEATSTDITVSPTACDAPIVMVWWLADVGGFNFATDELVRLVAMDANGETILVVAEAPDGGAAFDGLTQALQGILDSLTIE